MVERLPVTPVEEHDFRKWHERKVTLRVLDPSAGRRRSYSRQPLYPPSAAAGALPKLKLRIEPSPLRHHFAKATIQVRRHLDGTIALFFGPRCIGRFATFNKQSMDFPMPGDPLRLETVERGKHRIIELTRRRFLCLMFGYLAFVSLLLYLVGVGAMISAESVKALLPLAWRWWTRSAFVLLYVFVFANLLVTTLLGLYYMADRIHRHDPRDIQPGEPAEDSDE
jgi:hypothetical protein